MKLTNSQYNSIMTEYSDTRFMHLHELDERLAKIYGKYPRLKAIRETIASLSASCTIEAIQNGESIQDAKLRLREKILELKEEENLILVSAGLTEDDLQLKYTCPKCKDTGYIGNEQCICLKNRIISELYTKSNLQDTMKDENFDTFDYSYYSRSFIDSDTETDAYTNIKGIVSSLKDFVTTFDNQNPKKNFLICGKAGVGKTFLSNCVAKAMIDTSHSVIYLPAIKLFNLLSEEKFQKGGNEGSEIGLSSYIYQCDLLIIDDLGTELVNSFTISELFNIINERGLLKNSTIISTNLGLAGLEDVYSERIFSRLTMYDIRKIFGPDIRMQKTLSNK